MDFFETVHQRASVRNFSPCEIHEAQWEAMLRAAMAAPSAVNRQPWDFVLVRDREVLTRLAETLPYARMTAEAAGAVLVCATPERAYDGSTEFAVIDASLACQNLLLAATALGLGAVWTAVYPEKEREAAVRAILGVPEAVIPLALVPIGKPFGPVAAKDKFRRESIHEGSW
ncbi:MAG: nitroreductase family protein [Spirochaetaceae bacterium]|nr:nitroreductase family protein [Spirochaetaceae bacterium]